ncbi:MAG: GNAT family N-acetyltransferase [Pseudomonadota bacterium]
MDPEIRPARPGDTEAIVALIRAAYAPWRAELDDLPDVTGGISEEIAEGSVWIAELDGRPLGIVVASVRDQDIHLVNLAVAPEAGGRGIGSALVRAVEANAARQGVQKLKLATHARMQRNVRFYERLGCIVTARDGNKILMERRLPSAHEDG